MSKRLFVFSYLQLIKDYIFFKKQAERYGFNEKKYLEALAKVPVVSKEQVRSIMSFLQGMTQLITEIALKKVEQTELNKALKESEEKYRTLIQKIQTAVIVHTPDTQILICNHSAEILLGLSEDQLLGKKAIDPAYFIFKLIKFYFAEIHWRCVHL